MFTTARNVICIGTEGNDVDNSCYIGNIFSATSSGGTAVFVNSNGRVGATTSSRRFKDEIKPMGKTSEALFGLKPVSFRYKKEVDAEGDGKSQFGLVAEDVEKVNPDLIVRDKGGKPYSVGYDQVNAMLLNEFLKEHQKVEKQSRKIHDQESTITELEKEMETVVARLNEHDLKIERVSDQMQVNSPTVRVVAGNQ